MSIHQRPCDLPTQTAYARLLSIENHLRSHIGVSFSWKIRVPLAEGKLYSKFTYEILWIWLLTSIYLGTPKGHNFSLKRKNKLLGSFRVSDWNFGLRVISGYFLIFRLICLNLNLILERNQAQTREELKNYLVIPMLTVSCSRLVELDQAISSIIKNPKSYQTVERWTCIGGKRHILQALHRFMTHFISTICIGFETLGFQAWFGIANLNLWKHRAEFGQRPNIFMNNSGKTSH